MTLLTTTQAMAQLASVIKDIGRGHTLTDADLDRRLSTVPSDADETQRVQLTFAVDVPKMTEHYVKFIGSPEDVSVQQMLTELLTAGYALSFQKQTVREG